MLFYYSQLLTAPKRESETISEYLGKIDTYLRNAIEALKGKEIRASWSKLDASRVELKLLGKLYRVPKQEIVISEAFRGYQEGETVDARGKRYCIKKKLEDDKVILTEAYHGEQFFAKDGTLHEGKIEEASPLNLVSQTDCEYIVYFPEGETCDAHEAVDETKAILAEIKHIRCENTNYPIEVTPDGYIQPNERLEALLGKPLEAEEYPIISLVLQSKEQGAGRWIQLMEIEDEVNENETLSPLTYFFDDDISIKDDRGNSYLIYKQPRPDDYQLRLQKVGEKSNCYPPADSILKVEVNTYQLQLQRMAVRLLRERPLEAHLPLLHLFRDKRDVDWKDYQPQSPDEWFVLKETERPGCQEQRDFVAKALGTPDYAFLAGPPGSGKTTVIIELISQLIRSGKRVLLCGSTHVAIDNVLERLAEKGLIEGLGITALRIGDKGRISEKVKQFQIDEVLGGCPPELHGLVRASANLVCGTTMGILQHPDFKREWRDASPIVPKFDYLIIDESSKTTFQEFLVPALHAKRWVLVGDVMQLSPYTERELVEANLRNVSIRRGEVLSQAHQQAIYLLAQLESLFQKGGKETLHGHYAIPVGEETLAKLREEYSQGRGAETFNDDRCPIAFVGKEDVRHYNRLLLSPYRLIFIERSLVNSCILPETHAILWARTPEDDNSEHSFLFRALIPRIEHDFWLEERTPQPRKDNLEVFFQELARKLYTRSWAGEIAWRIDREHQTRLLASTNNGKIKKSYAEQISALMPLQDKALWISAINRIAAIAYPSILEALERGIIHLNQKESASGVRTTLAEGLDKSVLSPRRTILSYQHRMHPALSEFPRQRFYLTQGEEALLDNPNLERNWGYSRYPSRNHWKEVKGHTYRGTNAEEARVMMQELEAFVEYAQAHPPQDDPSRKWEVACLTFYRGQERALRELLCEKTQSQHSTHFEYKGVGITLCTVDRFQGQEADIVFLSMVQTQRVGFMDSPNRLNVALTRARYQNVIIGNREYFLRQWFSEHLSELAKQNFCRTLTR